MQERDIRARPGLDGGRRTADHARVSTGARMRSPLAVLRRASGLVGPALAVVLTCALLLVGAHHHGDGVGSHPCALCNASHASAAATGTGAAVPIPARLPERIDPAAPDLTLQPTEISPSSRAPPLL